MDSGSWIWITAPQLPSKINSKKVENFSASKSDRQPTSIYHASTINSPQNNHTQHHVFPKKPCKNAYPPRVKKIQQNHHDGSRITRPIMRMYRGKLEQCRQS
jgi:hypothetical protein